MLFHWVSVWENTRAWVPSAFPIAILNGMFVFREMVLSKRSKSCLPNTNYNNNNTFFHFFHWLHSCCTHARVFGRRDFCSCARLCYFHTRSSLLSLFLCLIYFLLHVPISECLGKHSCTSSTVTVLSDVQYLWGLFAGLSALCVGKVKGNNTIIHFIETRLQNTIGTVIKIQMAWLTGWQVLLIGV